jgi:hypothetical protein
MRSFLISSICEYQVGFSIRLYNDNPLVQAPTCLRRKPVVSLYKFLLLVATDL